MPYMWVATDDHVIFDKREIDVMHNMRVYLEKHPGLKTTTGLPKKISQMVYDMMKENRTEGGVNVWDQYRSLRKNGVDALL